MNTKRKYVFVLCPPFQGSTPLFCLLNSSKNISTFIDKVDLGEGQDLFEKEMKDYIKNRWNPDYNINMDLFSKIYHSNWDLTKKILADKSPPHICRAKKIEEEFSKFGEVYFVVSIRNPYSTNGYSASEWIKYAKYQKYNIENLKNVIVTNYEELCNNTDKFIEKIKNKIPELNDIKNIDTETNWTWGNDRSMKINNKNVNRILNMEIKNKILKNEQELLNYFGYSLII